MSLKRIRRAARRGYLRVRVTRRGKNSLRGKSKRARKSASKKPGRGSRRNQRDDTDSTDDDHPGATAGRFLDTTTDRHKAGRTDTGDRDARSGDRRLHDGPEPARPRPVAAGMLATVRGHEPVQPADTGRCASHVRLVVACREPALGGQWTERRQGQHPRGRRLPQEHLLGPRHGPGVHRQGWLDDRTLRRRWPQGADAGRSTPDCWRATPIWASSTTARSGASTRRPWTRRRGPSPSTPGDGFRSRAMAATQPPPRHASAVSRVVSVIRSSRPVRSTTRSS